MRQNNVVQLNRTKFKKTGGLGMKLRALDWVALTLVILGAINWGLIGFFQFDIIADIFGGMNVLISRIIYAVIALSGLYCLSLYGRLDSHDDSERDRSHDFRPATEAR
jgi:uncharacterized membrane protein YuzA (DUF378 family)